MNSPLHGREKQVEHVGDHMISYMRRLTYLVVIVALMTLVQEVATLMARVASRSAQLRRASMALQKPKSVRDSALCELTASRNTASQPGLHGRIAVIVILDEDCCKDQNGFVVSLLSKLHMALHDEARLVYRAGSAIALPEATTNRQYVARIEVGDPVSFRIRSGIDVAPSIALMDESCTAMALSVGKPDAETVRRLVDIWNGEAPPQIEAPLLYFGRDVRTLATAWKTESS